MPKKRKNASETGRNAGVTPGQTERELVIEPVDISKDAVNVERNLVECGKHLAAEKFSLQHNAKPSADPHGEDEGAEEVAGSGVKGHMPSMPRWKCQVVSAGPTLPKLLKAKCGYDLLLGKFLLTPASRKKPSRTSCDGVVNGDGTGLRLRLQLEGKERYCEISEFDHHRYKRI